jgi:hypothetical protein
VSDNQVTVACATLEKLCQISLLPLRTEHHQKTSSEINTINLLNFILMSPKTHVQYATERDKARAKYRATFDRQINRRFDQYVAEDEEEEEDDTHDKLTNLAEEFEALVVEVEETDAAKESDVFVTEAGHLIKQAQATDIVRKLSDKAVTHALFKDNNSYDYANSNECFVTDQYRPGEFHGVMIDTGAAGKSTAGYNQYTAYEKLFGEIPIDTG